MAARRIFSLVGLRTNIDFGYTLLEFVLVVGVFGLLMLILIPTYQQARQAAVISRVVRELLAYGRACSIIHATGIGETPPPRRFSAVQGQVRIRKGCMGMNSGASIEGSWGDARAAGISCLKQHTNERSRLAILVINGDSEIECHIRQ